MKMVIIHLNEDGKFYWQDLQLVDCELRKLLTVLPAGPLRGGIPSSTSGRLGPKTYVLKKSSRSGRDERLPAAPPTKDQLDAIDHLRQHVGYVSGPKWQAWCQRVCGHPWPQTRAEAGQIIEALKAMDARGWRATAAAGHPAGPRPADQDPSRIGSEAP